MKLVQLGSLEESVAYQEIKEDGRREGFEEGRREGYAEGFKEGYEEVREEAGRAILTRLLTQKFGALPEWALSRLQSGKVDELYKWSDRLFTAETLERIFE